MNKNHRDKIHKVNCLTNDLNSLYHQVALKFGMSDSAMFVLYMAYDKGGNCLLYDICNESGISKQTINSAVRKLENENIIYLEKIGGKTKRVCLTDEGEKYAQKTVARLFLAECNAFEAWS